MELEEAVGLPGVLQDTMNLWLIILHFQDCVPGLE